MFGEEKKVYLMEAVCANCGSKGDYEVPRGVTKKAFLKGGACNDCGCESLEPGLIILNE